MFTLSEGDATKTIIGVGDGPASFNTEMRTIGKPVVSIDPLCVFQSEGIYMKTICCTPKAHLARSPNSTRILNTAHRNLANA